MLGKGCGGAGDDSGSEALSVLGLEVASNEEEMYLSGSNEGRLGYCQQSPIVLKAV